MPLKFNIGRRKSAGTSLEEIPITEPPVHSSFRVLDRPSSSYQAYDVPRPPFHTRRTGDDRPFSAGRELDFRQGEIHSSPVNRGSAGTQLSGSSGQYETSGSSLRYSDSSTVPSTTSLTQYDEPKTTPKGPSFLKSASKALTFGSKKAQPHSIEGIQLARHSTHFDDIPDQDLQLRKRATTDLSQLSEATERPYATPRQNDWRLSIPSTGDDGFSSMFADHENTPRAANKRSSVEAMGLAALKHMEDLEPSQTFRPPPPLQLDGVRASSPGPSTAGSQASFDNLMANSPADDDDEEEGYSYRTGNWHTTARTDSPVRNLTPSPSNALLGNDSSQNSNRVSMPIIDKATKNMLSYFNSSKGEYTVVAAAHPSPPSRAASPPRHDYPQHGVTLTDGDWDDSNSIQQSRQGSIRESKKEQLANESDMDPVEEVLDTDIDFQQMASAAARIEAGEQPMKEPRKPEGKVMTAAQFERYKREKELYRSNSNATEESEKEDEDAYDSDDEIERAKEITKQRRNQEAKMAVYRQQMQRVMGEKTVPPIAASQLHPKASMNNMKGKGKAKEVESDDEDDDVPLGILAAHGFPGKDRAPSRLPQNAPRIQYASDSYPAPLAPSASTPNLPVFARNLPQDPHSAPNLVNPVSREAMGFNSGSRTGSVYGGSQSGSPAVPPPGGLIGIIAKEEQARALRRGHAHNTFESSNAQVGLPSMAPNYPQTQSPGPGMISPEMQAQMQINQQFQQMMQMQMQMLQQMSQTQNSQMSGMSMVPPMGQMPGMMPQQGFPQNVMPQQGFQPNMMVQQGFPPNMIPQRGHSPNRIPQQATPGMSMPCIPTIQVPGSRPGSSQAGRAPSIAPSERSNIGQPSRYRPVSIAPRPGASERTSSLLTPKPVPGQPQTRPKLGASATTSDLLQVRPLSTRPASSRPISTRPMSTMRRVVQEDDDEAGWEELRKKQEGKKKLWKSKRTEAAEGKENALEGVFYPTDIPEDG